MAKPSVEAVVFDIGGVIIDWSPAYLYEKLITDHAERATFLRTVCTPEWNEEQDRGRSIADGTALLIAAHPQQRELIDAFYGRWDEMIRGAIPGTSELIAALDARGVPLYCLTNFSAETFPYAMAHFPALAHFRDIVVSGKERLIKPNPAIYHRLLERTGLRAERTLFIDDREDNVAAAVALGFFGHVFTDAASLARHLAQHGIVLDDAERKE